MEQSISANGVEDLPQVAKWLLEKIGDNILISIEGEMGVGKTTFIKVLCEYMQVEDEVSSPTYSLVNEYFSPRYGTIYHFDFYRLEDEDEALDMGIEDYLYSGGYCLMEWPEKIRKLIPDECNQLKIEVEDNARVFKLNHPNL